MPAERRPGVIVRECAITDKPGTVSFYQFEPGSAYNTADVDWASSMMDGSSHMHLKLSKPIKISVQARTIREIEAEFRPIKYLKIDAEGHEDRVLSTLSYPIQLVSQSITQHEFRSHVDRQCREQNHHN